MPLLASHRSLSLHTPCDVDSVISRCTVVKTREDIRVWGHVTGSSLAVLSKRLGMISMINTEAFFYLSVIVDGLGPRPLCRNLSYCELESIDRNWKWLDIDLDKSEHRTK